MSKATREAKKAEREAKEQSITRIGSRIFVESVIPNSSPVSRVRRTRDYLLTQYVADELNTYRTWTPFQAWNDAYATKYNKQTGEEEVSGDPKGPGAAVRSIFNKAGGVMMGDGNMDVTKGSSEWRMGNNVPLMDSPEVRKTIRKNSACSVRDLVNYSEQGLLGRATYAYSDFMYCKWLGRVPNSYLITLRRFPIPVDDYISSAGSTNALRSNTQLQSQTYPSIGCMVTWMGTPGNEMSNILKYTVSMPYTEKTAQMQDVGNSADNQTGFANSIAAAFDKKYRKQYAGGYAGEAYNAYVGDMFGKIPYVGKYLGPGSHPYNTADLMQRDSNKVYGPVDSIKRIYMRSEDGIDFKQTITLTFDYEMRSYNGINQRQAFLDLLSNILQVVYTTGTFWGGGYRGTGAHQNDIFANMNIFKCNGGFTDFVDALTKDVQTIGSSVKSGIAAGGGILNTLKSMLNSIGGMLMGNLLNKLGRPQKQFVNSLLSPAPVGFWHLMVGNPNHPIISIGNMVLKEATIEHYGPLGIDDFPTGLKVTCTLERGKPRDIRDIEKMYMKGVDRVYFSMSKKVLDVYKNAKEYKGGISTKTSTNPETPVTEPKNVNKTATGDYVIEPTQPLTADKLRSESAILKKYFGTDNTDAIIVVAREQEDGSQKALSKEASGDSRKKGTGGHSAMT